MRLPDEEDLTADGGVGQAGDDAGGGGALGDLGFETLGAEELGEVLRFDGDRLALGGWPTAC